MKPGSSTFTYLEIPEGCDSILPNLDTSCPHFSRLMKKISRKITSGKSHVRQPLKQSNDNGELVRTGYEIVGSLESEPRHLLLACELSSDGSTEVHRFPCVRLVVRKVQDGSSDDNPVSNNSHEEVTLRGIVERLDQISSKLDNLSSNPTQHSGSHVANGPKSASKNGVSQSARASIKKSQSFPVVERKSQSMDANHESERQTGCYSVVSPHSSFVSRLDNTIDDVLSCIRRGKDEEIFSNLQSKLITSLDALPPPSAQIMNSTEETIRRLKSPTHKTPKNAKKRAISPDLLQELDKIEASSPTKMRFTPLTRQPAKTEQSSPNFLLIDPDDDTLAKKIDSIVEKESRKNARRESKSKTVKSRQHDSFQIFPDDSYFIT